MTNFCQCVAYCSLRNGTLRNETKRNEIGTLRLFMGISDETEDATIAIDETKISEIEATKRRFVNYCVQTKY